MRFNHFSILKFRLRKMVFNYFMVNNRNRKLAGEDLSIDLVYMLEVNSRSVVALELHALLF